MEGSFSLLLLLAAILDWGAGRYILEPATLLPCIVLTAIEEVSA